MPKRPELDSVSLAVSCVAETNVVASGVVPRSTCAPEMKLVPVTASEKFPVPTLAGFVPESVGVGFKIVTALEEAAEVKAALVAVTVSVLGVGSVDGAV
jgi:hypothetical protein